MNALVFLGIQGSGKGTQANIIAERLGYYHINIGDLFRKQVKEGTAIGIQVSNIIQRGDLVSDELVFEVISATLSTECRGLIFDGFPRTLAQAEFLRQHYKVLRVYYLDLREDDAIARIADRLVCKKCSSNYNTQSMIPQVAGICDNCGGELISRPDDNPEAIHKRFEEFYKETFPLKEYFEQLDLLTMVEANASIDEITANIYQDIIQINGLQ